MHTPPSPGCGPPPHPLVPVVEGQGDFSLIAGRKSPDLLVAAIITSNLGGSRSGVLLSVWGRGPTYQHCSQAFCPQSLQGTISGRGPGLPQVVQSWGWGVSVGHKLGSALAINKMVEALNARPRPSLSHTKFSSSSFDSASEGSGVPAAQLPGWRTPMERPRKQVAWRRWHEDM